MVSLYIKVLKSFMGRRGAAEKRDTTAPTAAPMCLQARSIPQHARAEPRPARLRILPPHLLESPIRAPSQCPRGRRAELNLL